MRDEHIETMMRSYDFDAVAQLQLIVEQLEVCQELLTLATVPSARAALLLLDHHAEILLGRHTEAVIAAGDSRGIRRSRTYVTSERATLRSRFDAKLAVAGGVGTLGAGLEPLLSKVDIAILRLGHDHRNAAQHGDRHNPATLQLVCLLQFRTVCHLMTAVTPHYALAASDERLADLLGGPDPPQAGSAERGLRDISRAIEDRLISGIELQREHVQGMLAEDLVDRASQSLGVVRELISDGIEPWRVEFAMRNAEFCDAHLADPDLVELEQRSDSWLRRDGLDADPEAVRADIAAANDARNARWSELEETFKPKARLDAISTVLKSAMKLTETTSLAHAINLYRGLDEPLRAVERYLPDAVKAWGEMVQRDIDIALGK